MYGAKVSVGIEWGAFKREGKEWRQPGSFGEQELSFKQCLCFVNKFNKKKKKKLQRIYGKTLLRF